jgi:hypothetical protein
MGANLVEVKASYSQLNSSTQHSYRTMGEH